MKTLSIWSSYIFANHKSLLFVVIISKLLAFMYLIISNYNANPEVFIGIGQYMGDSQSYILPIDQFLETGTFQNGNGKFYIHRMPYYGMFYGFFKLFFTKKIAISCLVILQLTLEIISSYLFIKIVGALLKSNTAKLIFLIIFISSLYITNYAFRIYTESLSLSFFIFSIVYLYNHRNQISTKSLLISGLFFAIAVLLKPYIALYYVFFGISFIFLSQSSKWIIKIRKAFLYSLLFFAPFLVLNAAWIIRNYAHFNRLIIMNDYQFDELEIAYRSFLKHRGETLVNWDQSSAGCYFSPSDEPCNFVFTENFISANSAQDEIQTLRDEFVIYYGKSQPIPDSIEAKLINEFNRLNDNYRKDKPFNYYIGSKLRLTSNFLFHSGSYYLPFTFSIDNPINAIIKMSQSFLYYIVLILGSIGLILLIKSQPENTYFYSIPFFIILFIPIIYGAMEWRFFFHFYLFGILGTTYLIDLLIRRRSITSEE